MIVEELMIVGHCIYVRRIISDYYTYFEYTNYRILMSEWRCVGHTRHVNETRCIQGRTLCEDGTSLTSTMYHARTTLACEYLRIVQNRGP